MSEQVMKTYKVFPHHPGVAPKEVAKGGAEAVRVWEIDQTRRNLVMIRDGIRKIFNRHGGNITHDAMGYGNPGEPDENEAFVVIECTPVVAYFVSQNSYVGNVHEVRDPKKPEMDHYDPPSPTL